MRLTILEKRTKYYDSPFYKITEDADNYARINTPLPRTSTFDQSQGFNEAQQAAADARFEQELALGRTIRQFVGTPEEAALLAGQPERFRAIGTQRLADRAAGLPGTPNLRNSKIEADYNLRRSTVETPKPPPPPPRPPRRRR
jgi:hypothetical protein